MFLNILLKSKYRTIYIILTLLILSLAIGIILMLRETNVTKNGKGLKGKLDLSFKNYYVSYDMTVISNKNINTYNVEEWHKEGEKTRLKYLDYMKNEVTITIEGNTCTISNTGNTAKLVVNNMIENKNISSLSTFGDLYNMDCNSCSCTKSQNLKDDEMVISIVLNDRCECGCKKIIDELGVSEFKLILVNGVPKNYIVLDKNKKEYISIVYNIYKQNVEI